jgi:diguanylate cyclase (GGDEF)-like protein
MPLVSPNIRIDCQSPERAEWWRAALAAEGFLASQFTSAEPSAPPPDVILTDQPSAVALNGALGGISRAEIGLVSVAGEADGEADVVLASDATARELALACRLLGEVVRLRRAQRTQQNHQHELEQLAYLDPLTEVANRRTWDNELARRVARLGGGGPPFCLALVDVDHFKAINDEHGHLVGDAVLRALARALRTNVRDHDLVARLGGDEFGLLLAAVTPGFAAEVVDRIRARALAMAASAHDEPVVPFRASAGYCCSEADVAATPEALYATADRALNQAKMAGRDRTASPSPS